MASFIYRDCINFKPRFWTNACCRSMRMLHFNDVSDLSVVQNCNIGYILFNWVPVFNHNLVTIFILDFVFGISV